MLESLLSGFLSLKEIGSSNLKMVILPDKLAIMLSMGQLLLWEFPEVFLYTVGGEPLLVLLANLSKCKEFYFRAGTRSLACISCLFLLTLYKLINPC